ncbi:testin-like [Diaphorina citri]|uniref:Testin-like n=1 Tax=Diaphorina citri TaxID=121845 RepID=A0A3Q0JPD5_DIACI|nr:testin-like [Diaphorina citri]
MTVESGKQGIFYSILFASSPRRKVCKNCKCKKESHDVREEDDISAKFEILFGLSKCTPSQAVLDLKLRFPGDDEEGGRGVLGGAGLPSSYPKREYKLDWIPPNVSSELAAEYMQQLPAGKLPISGSDGALKVRSRNGWKVCKNCKCKKESHDVREEDDISAKFEILFGQFFCTPSQAVLDLKLRFPGDDEEGGRGVLGGAGLPSSYPKREYKLDWIPPNVSSELVSNSGLI